MKTKLIKLAFIDTETTGLNPIMNDPFQIAIIYRTLQLSRENGAFKFEISAILEEKVFLLRPLNFDTISPQALEVNGITEAELKLYPAAGETFPQIISFLDAKVDRFNKADKIIPVGYNVKFDMDFIFKLAEKMAFKFMGSYFSRKSIDVLDHFRHISLLFPGVFPDSINLGNVCNTQGVCVNLNKAHDALADIKATMELFEKFMMPQMLAIQSSDSKILGGIIQ